MKEVTESERTGIDATEVQVLLPPSWLWPRSGDFGLGNVSGFGTEEKVEDELDTIGLANEMVWSTTAKRRWELTIART